MASSALVNQLLQSLSFEVEAVPQDNSFNVKNSPNLTPLNVKVRVRKKDVGNAVVRRGILSVPKPEKPDGPPERVRLASSDQTVMSFNMLMEAEFERKPFRKPKRNFFGLCLGVQGDDDDKYLPSTSLKGKEIDSKSDNGIISTKPSSKNPYDGSSSPSSYMKRDRYFGKCKPGGCLDPPFGEDKYVYQPKHTEGPVPRVALADELKEKKVKSDFLDASPSKSREKEDREGDNILSLYKQKTDVAEIDSDSIITYPSEPRLHEDKFTKHKKASVSKQTRDSFNEQNSPYFNPPKTRKESSNTEKSQIIKTGLPASGSKFKSKDSSKTYENYHGEAGDEMNKGHENEAQQLISVGGTTVAEAVIDAATYHENEKLNPKSDATSEPSTLIGRKPVEGNENTANSKIENESGNMKFLNKEKGPNINNQMISQETTSDNLGPKEKTRQKDVPDERPTVTKEKLNQMVTDASAAFADKQNIHPVFEKNQKDSSQPTPVAQEKTGKKDVSNKASQKTTPRSLSKEQTSESLHQNGNNATVDAISIGGVKKEKDYSNETGTDAAHQEEIRSSPTRKKSGERLGLSDREMIIERRHIVKGEKENKANTELNNSTSDTSVQKTTTPNGKVSEKDVTGKKKVSNKSSLKHSSKSTSKDIIPDKLGFDETIDSSNANDGRNETFLEVRKESNNKLNQVDKKDPPRSASKDRTLEKNNVDMVSADTLNIVSSQDKINKDVSLNDRESTREYDKIQQRRDSNVSEGVQKKKTISKEASKNITPRSLSRERSSQNQTIEDKIVNRHGKVSQKSTPRSLSLDRASEYNDLKGKIGKRDPTGKPIQKHSPRSLSLDRSSENKSLEGKTGRKDSTGKAFQKHSPRSLSHDRASENKDLDEKIGKRNSIGKPNEKTTPRSLSREKFLENKNVDEEKEQKNSNKASQKTSARSISREIPDNSSFVTKVSQKSENQNRKGSGSILSERIRNFPRDKNEIGEKTPELAIDPMAAFHSQDKESLSSRKSRGNTSIAGVLKKDSSHRYSPNKSSKETSIKFLSLETPEMEKSDSSEIGSHKKVPNHNEVHKFESDFIYDKNTDLDKSDQVFMDYQTDKDIRTDSGSHKDIYNQTYEDSTSISPIDTILHKDNERFTSSDVDTLRLPANSEDQRVSSLRSPVTDISGSGSGKDVRSSKLAIDVYFDIEATDVSTERISGKINKTDSTKPKSLITDLGDSSYLMDVDNFDETQGTEKRSKSLSIELELVVEGLKRKDDEKSIPEEMNADAFKNVKDNSLNEKQEGEGEIRNQSDKKIESKEILSNQDQKYIGDALRKSDKKTDSSETRLVKSKSEDSIFLNLAFQTYLEDNQTVVRTIDSLKDNDADNVVMVKSLWKSPEMNEITVPIDSGRVMQIQIKRTNVNQMDRKSKLSKPLISKFDKVSGKLTSSSSTLSLGKRLSVTLSAVYSQDLVPLQEIIKGLKQDIDDLASQQIKLRERVGWAPGKPKQLNVTTCGCLKNTYENLSSF